MSDNNYSIIHNQDHLHLFPSASIMRSNQHQQSDEEIIQGRPVSLNFKPVNFLEDLILYFAGKFEWPDKRYLMVVYILNTVFQLWGFLGFIGFIIAVSNI